MNILFIELHNKNPFDVKWGSVQRSNLIIQGCSRISNLDVVVISDEFNISKSIENCNIISLNISENEVSNIKLYEYWNKYIRSIWKDEAFFSNTNKDLESKLDNIICKGNYDKIVIRYLPDAIKCGLIKYGERLVVDIDDSPISINRNKYNKTKYLPKKLLRFYVYKQSYKKVIRILKKIGIAYFSNIDELIGDNSYFLPNIPFYESNLNLCDYSVTKNRILFVGLITFKANIEGIDRFFRNIFPNIKKSFPDVEVHIVGKCNYDDLPDWKYFDNVYVKGFVEDIEREYKDCKLVIAPIYEGAGTNIKVLEAMQMMRPCVTTPNGIRGFRGIFKSGIDLLVSNTDKEFSDNVISLLNNEKLNHQISSQASISLSSNFSKPVFFKIIQDSIIKNHKQ